MKRLCPATCGCVSATPSVSTTAPAEPTTTPSGSSGCGLDDKAFDCKKKSQMCNVPAYINLMKKLCPETCGCPTSAAPASTTPNAPTTAPAVPTTAPAVPTTTPAVAATTPAASATTPAVAATTPAGSNGCGLDDKAFDCKRKSQMCTVPAYINLMKRLCPETCGCPTTIAPQSTTPNAPATTPALPTTAPAEPTTTPAVPTTTPSGSSGCGLDDKAFDCKRKSQMCTVPAYVNLMKRLCPETCGCPTSNAPQYTTPLGSSGCGLDDKAFDCKRKSQMCTVPAYVNLMKKLCPETCGCPTSTAPQFTTPSRSGGCGLDDKTIDCKRKSQMCTVPAYINLMKKLCPETCGCPSSIAPRFTTPSPNSQGSCSDKMTDCVKVAGQCKIKSYFKLMKKKCEMTCNFCGDNSFPG